MPWDNTPAKRRRDAQVYGNAEYIRNRVVVLRRANGRCEQCGTTSRRLQVDHIVPASIREDHSLANLRALCAGPGSCHARKSAAEGNAAARGNADPDHQPRYNWD